MKPVLNDISRPAVYLASFAIGGVLLLAGIQYATSERIANNERAALLREINALVPVERYDNKPTEDVIELNDADSHSSTTMRIYRARAKNQPVAAIYLITTKQGYSGTIKLAVAVNADQSLAGVRILNHKETPGLGDRIETEKSDWILQFAGKSLQNPALTQWAVKKDGGSFDQFTGATITPRAVVNSVKHLLQWAQEHQEQVFKLPALQTQESDDS